MECGRIREQLGFYVDGALGERDSREIADHLAGCAECRAELAALRTLIETSQSIEAIEPPVGLRAAIAAATTQKAVKELGLVSRLRATLSPGVLRWAGGLAGAAVLTVGLLVSLRQAQIPTRPPARAPSPAQVSAQGGNTRPAPAEVVLAPTPSGPKQAVAVPAPKRRVRAARAEANAAHSGAPVLAGKTAAKPVHEVGGVTSGEPETDVGLSDTTTVAETISTAELKASASEETEASAKLAGHPLVKVASTPLPKAEDAEKWLADVKAEAAMHRRGSPVGMSLIQARF